MLKRIYDYTSGDGGNLATAEEGAAAVGWDSSGVLTSLPSLDTLEGGEEEALLTIWLMEREIERPRPQASLV